ncbi:MAG: hypothetical protein FRX49_00482 [Trebouxia sp. A1-2]|nr:MAG: hypothetical protein FRX49_00482 [Trebouxia sp. A1-2]
MHSSTVINSASVEFLQVKVVMRTFNTDPSYDAAGAVAWQRQNMLSASARQILFRLELRIQELEAQCLDCSTLTAQLQTKDAAIEALQQRLDQLEDERLLRELLPSSGISPDVVNTSRGSQSQEDWLVSSETKSAVHDAVHEVTDVQQRLQLHEVLADQLQGQLQQQQESKERLEQSLREQQDVAATLKIQLDQSRNEAEELRSQIAVSHGREEEARQRVQLQDVLGEQLLSQLQEVTQQRDEHKSIAHELRSALADMSRQSDRLPANQSSATTSSQVVGPPSVSVTDAVQGELSDSMSPSGTKQARKSDKAFMIGKPIVKICCNALYGSPEASDSPPGSLHSLMIPMSGSKAAHPSDDTKENVAPTDIPLQPCLNSQFAMAVVDRPRHKSVHVSPDETPSIGPGPINRANSSATVIVQPLQPHQAAVPSWSEAEVTDTQMPVRLLPVPATSALAAHPSHSSDHLLSQQSSQFESDRMTHGMSRQPPADECLFGSPPRGQNDNHVQHSSAHRQESVYHTAVGGLALLDSVALGTKPEALGAAVAAETADGSAILMTEDSEQSFMELLQAAQQQRMFAEAVLQPGHLPDPAASLQDVPVSLTHSAAAMQWELQHLKENLAAAKQQEADTMHRVRDTERQLASLQTALAQQQEHHDRQSAQISKEADAKVECIKALQEDLSELQRQLAAQRQQLESNETQLQQLSEAKEEEERHLHRLQAKLWQEASRQSLDEVAPAEAPSAGFVNKSTTELESNASSMLQAAYTRVKGQYQAAAKRINELEALQQLAMTVAQEHQLAMHQKQAELVATKQSVRSAVADHMRSMPASASQVAKYDDLIEEASGELERVEGEVHSATQQLLDLQGHVSQLAHHTQAAEKTLQKKEEEVRSMQAELHSTLAGVTAARHEQQEEQRKIAQLKHQHEDTLQRQPQAEAHVRTQMTEVQAELQALKASRQRHAEQQKDKDQVTIRLNREAEAAALGQKQACENLKAVQSDLKAAEEELQRKQCMAENLRAKVADSQHELSSLQKSLHALHAEVATAQQAHDEVSAQLSEARLQLEGRQMQFIRLSQDQSVIHQDDLEDQQIMSDLVRHTGSGHPLELQEAVSPSQHQQVQASVAGSVSNAGQMENLQTIHAEQLLLLASTTEPSARVNARLEQAVADDEQQTAHLKARLRDEEDRRQQAERQLLQMQHGSLPTTSLRGSPLPQGSPLPADCHQITGSAELPEKDRCSQQRLQRRLQRLQDERIHLEGVLAHERSLLAQQQSDNANLRSLLAQHQTHTPAADGGQAVTLQQHDSIHSHQHRHQAHVRISDTRQHAAQQQSDSKHSVQFDDFHVGEGAQDWETRAMQLQAELSLLQSQHDAVCSELAEQRAASSHVRQQLKQAVMSRTDVSAWEAHAVQMEAEHEVVTSELHAVKEQLRTYAMQVADLEAFNGKLTDECLMRKQQAEYLHGRMETCQQEISILESEQQQGTTDAQIAVSSLQDELRLTKQAFHAKQDQLEDACCKLQETQASLHDIQHALQSSQGEAQSLQTRMDAATRGKQEAEALCHHLRDEVQKLQGQLAGTHHSMTLFQSQQLELQSGGSQLESMQVLLRDARQHAADLQTDKQQLQHMQNRLKQALLKANQEITQLQASAAEGAERSAAAVQAQQGLQNEVQAQQQATEAEAKHQVETTAALERQLAAVQAELALAQDQCRQAMLKPDHVSCSNETEAADMQHPKLDSAGEQEETAAEKKLLRAEVASLKRQAAQQRKSLQIIQHDVHQVPQSVRVAAFRKAALIRLSETLQEALHTVKNSKNVLLQSAQHANRVAMIQQVRQQMSLIMELLSAIRHSSTSAAHSSD